MTTTPLVSICIPSYRGAAFLGATIESVLSQSYENLELWVVDDASPDATAQIVRAFDDPRVHLRVNDVNLGPMANWNRCLALATGKYYKLLPQDDLLAPGSLAEHVAILEADVAEGIALVFGSRTVIDRRGRSYFGRGLSRRLAGRMDRRELVRRCIHAGTNLIGEPGNALIRRSIVGRVGGYDTQHPYMVDLDYWFRVLAWGDAWYTGKCSSSFRVSQASWSVALGTRQLADFRGFVQKVSADTSLGITQDLISRGFLRARLNTLGRALLYRSMFAER